jgi:serine O-acetyltransferase
MTSSQTLSFWRTIALDVKANKVTTFVPAGPALFKHVLWGIIFSPRFNCVFWYRVNRLLHLRKLPGRALLSAWRFYWFGNEISYMADIGPGFRLSHVPDVVIGASTKIGNGFQVYNGVTLGGRTTSEGPVVGDNVLVYTGAKVLGHITIGDNVTIGALSLCIKDVPANHVMYGIPPNVTVAPHDERQSIV